ncbi:MAG TPA: LytR family transcriptional regulator, partial [Candidatus Dorea stercoravium]|nr:LytR family transcriptional regulator [Candidatus Dorea stercoravium]
YARIRYTDGNDFKRTERQRIVLEKVMEKAKSASFSTLNKIVDEVFPQISTSFSSTDLLGFAANALNYNIVDTSGFPFEVTTSENVRNHSGSYVVPIDFSANVSRLHEFLFGEEDYTPSETVEQIDNDIIYLTGVDESTTAMQSDFTESEDTGEE